MLQVRQAARAFACAVAGVVIAGAASAQTPVNHPPVEAFGNLPFASNPILSRDGKYLATIQSVLGRPTGAVYNLDAGTPPVPLPTGEWILEGLRWAPDDRLILTVKQNAPMPHGTQIYTWTRAIVVDPDGKNATTLMRNMATYPFNTNTANILDLNAGDSDHVLSALYNINVAGSVMSLLDDNQDKARLDLVSVDLKTGKASIMMQGEVGQGIETLAWITDGGGKVVGRVDQSSRPLKEHVLLLKDGSWSEAGVFDATGDKGSGVLGLTEDGKALAMLGRDARTMQVLDRFDLETHQRTPLFAAPDSDVDGVKEDQWTGRIVGAVYVGERRQYHYFDTDRQAVQLGVEQAFPGLTVSIISSNMARDRVILAVDGPQAPLAYYYLNRTTHQATLVGKAYPGLNPGDLGEMKPYPYKARDGLDIPAYITLPPGKTPKNLPAVVMPHGGPDARDYLAFDWWAQFLANRGYVVLQPNFRGSAGYGHKFTEAGLHQWGLKMQDDISDGVQKMIADGIVDPKRICIVGASYGGYAALAGATFTPDMYACAVSWAGVSDLPTIMGTESHHAGKESQTVSFWTSRIGSVFDDVNQLKNTSPARNAARVKCPVLLMHGEGDTTVLIGQSEIEEKALRAAGKQVTFIRFSGGEDHYMNTAATRIRMLTEIEKFLKANIGD
jgi:dipeptidyl aminopeptidase/acylaminoacyl peptidase